MAVGHEYVPLVCVVKRLSTGANVWSEITVVGDVSPPAREGHVAVYDNFRSLCVVSSTSTSPTSTICSFETLSPDAAFLG